ncbi:type IV pilus twitching motility protein PilT [Verrucomicrobium sp. BvORR034]|jgi:twitching motility protein PilT|uniref:type IV pilus twitching motility protein PilT n=1 Tax=Verrucomicrobium sp. BvORR034 TaxID=1396418 RepID=UPI000AC396A1|nr:type IV pilus twitching motility protein PilT [Verrucomicrobium sp. BvORR034]
MSQDQEEAVAVAVAVEEEAPKVATLSSVDEYLQLAQQYDCSDLHLATGSPPMWRRYGTLQPIWNNASLITAEEAQRLAYSFLTDGHIKTLEKRGDVDFAYSPNYGRFRCSVVQQRLGIDMVFRVISTSIRSIEDLALPETCRTLTRYHNGLVLVTGATGSGKSTTLAALVDEVNKEREDHIITLEDPIEFVFAAKGCHVNQREVGSHTQSFAAALRGALREDPDVIMVGEMRDLETISLAITAAETGHLVLGTLHTGNAPRTLDRVLDVFPSDQRDQIRIMVSESLRGIISQQLIPRQDGQGRIMALEILVNTPAVANCIREGKTFMLPGIMQTGKSVGMVTMDDSLKTLYSQGYISRDECFGRADDKMSMKKFLES